ncbi:Nicotinamide-nucleotide adenylyltransferase [uncultured archaeon]|nr:Nicotinamide-nucleotide adenylyltransferase [uncultured archaeon]
MKRGLFVGRFQPYHSGHHNALKNALKEVDEMVIVVGSAKESFQLENPFTSGERIEMTGLALKEDKIFDKCYIVAVDDISEFALWTQRIRAYCPKFDVVYTNNPLVKELFEADHCPVKKLVSNSSEIDSTRIRENIAIGESISGMVPKAVEKFLEKIDARKRILSITQDEVKQ